MTYILQLDSKIAIALSDLQSTYYIVAEDLDIAWPIELVFIKSNI